ncbi:MAG: phytanoyl-CoA dioxygenase family protein [Actinomycetota bacterium]
MDSVALDDWLQQGESRARALPNRGPIDFDEDGSLASDILAAYTEFGFYVFEQVVSISELDELRADIDDLLQRAPWPDKRSEVDRFGRPAAGLDMARNPWYMAAPLSDPWGGTTLLNGRHQVKMPEPAVAVDAPEHVPFMVGNMLELSEPYLRVFGHPGLLRIAEAINGPDFTPFTDVLFVKEPGVGPSVAWHQDGQTHWNSPEWDAFSHGFNMQLQLYGSSPTSGVWVVPGSHVEGKIDIRERVTANGGDQRLPDAVPLVCEPGDLTMVNRQMLHGSFANASQDRRVTVNFGFHKYASVIDQRGALNGEGKYYDADYVRERCRTIPLAIDARAQRFPDEERYEYAPFVGDEAAHEYTPENRDRILTDYSLRDLSI